MPDIKQHHTQTRRTTIREHHRLENGAYQPGARMGGQNRNRYSEPAIAAEDAKPLGFAERMLRNTAFCIAVLLCVLAVQQADTPVAAWVSGELRDIVTMDIDDSLGSLKFVKNLLPESAMVFWNIGDTTAQFLTPVATQEAEVSHAWSEREPWVAYSVAASNAPLTVAAAAAGEVMSLSYAEDQTILMRIRHENGMETVYGGISACLLHEGDWVEAGTKIGSVQSVSAFTFEIRDEGRSVNPAPLLKDAP